MSPTILTIIFISPVWQPKSNFGPTGFDSLVTINLNSSSHGRNMYSDLVTVTAPRPEPSSLLLLCAVFSCLLLDGGGYVRGN